MRCHRRLLAPLRRPAAAPRAVPAARAADAWRRCFCDGGGAAGGGADAALRELGEAACLPSEELTPERVRAVLALHRDMPAMSPALESSVGQQCLRVALSYPGWLMPAAWQSMPHGPQLQHGSVPAPSGTGEDARLLPLACDEQAFSRFASASADGDVVQQVKTSGAKAVGDYLAAEGSAGDSRLEGLALNWGEDDQLLLGAPHLQALRIWEATLRLEVLMQAELAEGSDEQPPASPALRASLSEAKMYFVRTPDNADLARDGTGQNVIVLTSLDVAAACAAAFGRQQLREVSAEELAAMAEQSAGQFGYSLTVGPERAGRHVAQAGEAHTPMWHSRTVSAAWLAEALRA